MEHLVVVRTSSPANDMPYTFLDGKWASPENSQNQVVRELFVQGYSVLVLFVGMNDIPLYMTRITNVRPKNDQTDILFSPTHPLGYLQTFMEFSTSTSHLLLCSNPILTNPILEYIRFRKGHQIFIPRLFSDLVIQDYVRRTTTHTESATLNRTVVVNYVI